MARKMRAATEHKNKKHKPVVYRTRKKGGETSSGSRQVMGS
jgi:hypothetical protein